MHTVGKIIDILYSLMKKLLKNLYRFCLGGIGYYLIETVYRALLHRGDVHWTMFIIGGLSLIVILDIDKHTRLPIIIKALWSGGVITSMEFILGYIYTYILHKPIWTYATADFMGIISFTWALLWCGLALLVLIGKRIIHKITKQND